jgi:hypothetical protein
VLLIVFVPIALSIVSPLARHPRCLSECLFSPCRLR